MANTSDDDPAPQIVSASRACRAVLNRLATGDWTLMKNGRDGMAGFMEGPKKSTVSVAAKTMNTLFSHGAITVGDRMVTDYEITNAGRDLIRSR